MDKEVTVDVGQNIASLIERLAQQIGTTADKVFPWYVEQAYLQGVTSLVAIVLALVIAVIAFNVSRKKADFVDGNLAAVICVAFGFALILALGSVFFFGPGQVRKIANPHFYAMTMLAKDIGRMRGR